MFIIILFSDGAVIVPATRAVNDAAARQIKRNGADIWTCATGMPGPIVEMNSAAKQGTYDVLVSGQNRNQADSDIDYNLRECWQVWLSVCVRHLLLLKGVGKLRSSGNSFCSILLSILVPSRP